MTEYNIALQIPFLSTGIELYQYMIMKYLSLHSANIEQDYRWHWSYLSGKQIQGKKLIIIRAKNMVKNKP